MKCNKFLLNLIGLTLIFMFVISCGNDSESSGKLFRTPNDLDRPTIGEWTLVPKNAGGMGLAKFYIMTYEAKAWNDANANEIVDSGEVDADGDGVAATSYIPVSIASDSPWRNIDASDAADECESLGEGYFLVSNIEWMAVARNIEAVNKNWTGGSKGSGCLFKGNNGGTTCGYDGSGDPDGGSSRNSRARLTLSNGETIYDFSGNLSEWVDWDEATIGFQDGPTTCNASTEELSDVACGALVDGDYNSDNVNYDNNDGTGLFVGGAGGAAIRSGSWSGVTSESGIYFIDLTNASNTFSNTIGLRCVFRP